MPGIIRPIHGLSICTAVLTSKYRFAFKMDDPAFGRVPEACPGYVEESDAATTKV
jgi:hypothetical protein